MRPVNETHGVDGCQGENDLCAVELGPFFWYVVVAHEVNEVTAWHVVHHHVQVFVVLEGEVQLKQHQHKPTISSSSSPSNTVCLCPSASFSVSVRLCLFHCVLDV